MPEFQITSVVKPLNLVNTGHDGRVYERAVVREQTLILPFYFSLLFAHCIFPFPHGKCYLKVRWHRQALLALPSGSGVTIRPIRAALIEQLFFPNFSLIFFKKNRKNRENRKHFQSLEI